MLLGPRSLAYAAFRPLTLADLASGVAGQLLGFVVWMVLMPFFGVAFSGGLMRKVSTSDGRLFGDLMRKVSTYDVLPVARPVLDPMRATGVGIGANDGIGICFWMVSAYLSGSSPLPCWPPRSSLPMQTTGAH